MIFSLNLGFKLPGLNQIQSTLHISFQEMFSVL